MAFCKQSTFLPATSFAGVSVPRSGAFSAARAAPRSLVVRAQQGPKEVAMKTFGALAAAQLALLPLSGAAVADMIPTTWDTADLQKPALFGFFEEKKEELKANVAEAAARKDDAAERVVPESPGSSQEENAEKVRREAENGPTEGGDARAPTN